MQQWWAWFTFLLTLRKWVHGISLLFLFSKKAGEYREKLLCTLLLQSFQVEILTDFIFNFKTKLIKTDCLDQQVKKGFLACEIRLNPLRQITPI